MGEVIPGKPRVCESSRQRSVLFLTHSIGTLLPVLWSVSFSQMNQQHQFLRKKQQHPLCFLFVLFLVMCAVVEFFLCPFPQVIPTAVPKKFHSALNLHRKKRFSFVLGPINSEPIPILGSPHAKVPSKIPSKVPAVRPSYWLTFLTFICDWLSHSSEPICALLNRRGL